MVGRSCGCLRDSGFVRRFRGSDAAAGVVCGSGGGRGVWWCVMNCGMGRWGGVMALTDSCEAGAAIAVEASVCIERDDRGVKHRLLCSGTSFG
jgi:hypothetical protein